MGFVFQTASMLPSLSVIQNVAVPSLFKGAAAPEDRLERAREVLTLVGLGDRTEALPRQLSGGEIRRVAIARALMNRPEILIADEPTSDLDVQTELKIIGALQNVHQTGVTVLMVTHSLELIPYATRALRMEDGRLLPLEDGLEAPGAAGDAFAEPKPSRPAGRPSPRVRSPGCGSRSTPPSRPWAWPLAVLLVLAGLLIGRAGNEPAAATAGTGPPAPAPSSAAAACRGSQRDLRPERVQPVRQHRPLRERHRRRLAVQDRPASRGRLQGPGRTRRHRRFRRRLRRASSRPRWSRSPSGTPRQAS